MTPLQRIESELDDVLAEIEQQLRTPPRQRTSETYMSLAQLHRREAACWRSYLEYTTKRVTWMAAAAAADRAKRTADGYDVRATAMTPARGQWLVGFAEGEAA